MYMGMQCTTILKILPSSLCLELMLALLRRSSRDSTNFGGKNARLSSYTTTYYIVSRHPIIVGSSDYFIVTFSHLYQHNRNS